MKEERLTQASQEGEKLMTNRKRLDFQPGEYYVFHAYASQQPVEDSFYGCVDSIDDGEIHLRVATADFQTFTHDVVLMHKYRFARLMTRDELRDFCYNHQAEKITSAPDYVPVEMAPWRAAFMSFPDRLRFEKTLMR